MVEIHLLDSTKVALVDDNDYERIIAYSKSWFLFFVHENYAYAKSVRWPQISLHKLVFGPTENGMVVDHKNGDPLDCQKENLRSATISQNLCNRRRHKNNVSGFKGVFRKTNRNTWVAQITKDKKQVHLGCFKDPVEAALAYDRAARAFHGEFARTNF